MPLMSQMIQQEPNVLVRQLMAQIGLLRDRLMPAVVTARNTPRTHNNSATGPFSETGMYCDGQYKWKTCDILIM